MKGIILKDALSLIIPTKWKSYVCILLLVSLNYETVAINTKAQMLQNLYGVRSGITYFVQLFIGQPEYNPETLNENVSNAYNLLLDTGSSNEAVISSQCCSNFGADVFDCGASNTCEELGRAVSVTYAQGSWSGILVKDTFSGPQLESISQVPFVEIREQKGFIQSGYEGIMGLAYPSVAQPSSNPPPTFFQTLVERGKVSNIFGLQLCGSLQPLVEGKPYIPHSGAWVMGGIQGPEGEIFHRGDIIYSPLVQKKWYMVIVTELAFDKTSLNMDCAQYNTPQAIVDSGTSNIVLPTKIFNKIIPMIYEAAKRIIPTFNYAYMDDDVVCCESYCNPADPNSPLLTLPDIEISLAFEDDSTENQFTITIPSTYYFRPVASQFTSDICRMIGISEGDGLVLGNVFMDGLYIVHNREEDKVGFAVADNCPNGATSRKQISKVHSSKQSFCDCLSQSEKEDTLLSSLLPGLSPCFFWFWWMYVMIVLIAIIFICLVYIFWVCCKKKCSKRRRKPLDENISEVLIYPELVPDSGIFTYTASSESVNIPRSFNTSSNRSIKPNIPSARPLEPNASEHII